MHTPSVFSKNKIIALWLCFILLLAVFLPVSAFAAAAGKKVVRVGWFESPFNRTDRFGRRSGYAYEYQQKIAAYTGWEYQYVTASWPQLFEMLKRGELDLLSDVSYSEERAKSMLYSALPMGEEDYYAYIAARNTEITLDDYSTINGKKVGVNRGSVQKGYFLDWAGKYGIEPEIVEMTGTEQDSLQKLLYGQIDMYISATALPGENNILPLCKIGSSSIYFAVSRNRPDLQKELDFAMNRILDEDRYYNQQLFKKHMQGHAKGIFFTPGEKNWLRQHDMIRVGYRGDYIPYCGRDEQSGKLTGALKDFLALASANRKNANIFFDPVAFSSINEALAALRRGEVDCVFPVNHSDYNAERTGVMVTTPAMRSAMCVVVRAADQKDFSLQNAVNAALAKGNPYHDNFLKEEFPHWNVTLFDTAEDCLKAVADGKADCYLISLYRLDRISDLCSKYKLTSLSTGAELNLSFALRRGDEQLYSILNKTVHLVPEAAVSSSLASYSTEIRKVTIADFVKDNLAAVTAVIAIVVAVILALLLRSTKAEKKAWEKQHLIDLAERDTLTGLYNNSFFFEYVSRIRREHPDWQMDAVAMDIEQFLLVNDLNGSEFGDTVLREFGREIEAFLKEDNGIACRIEGDRFNLFCSRQTDYQSLLDRFQDRLDSLARNVSIRLRMGVMPGQNDLNPSQLFNLAWTACNLVRGKTKHLMVYNEEIRSRENYNQRLLNDLRRALAEHEFKVWYQPKYNIQTEPPRLTSAEALVRWQHPELGLIPPADFIPLFEGNGQISSIDKYVWAEAARQIKAWKEKFGVTLPVSVNLSRIDIFNPELEAILDELVNENGLERQALKLEVTESAYTENTDQLLAVMERLRRKGFRIEMDDFGSGYSSLGSLSSMPVDVLKMDRSFVMNIDHEEKDLRLVELILDIARNLKLPVIAEGVETESQLSLLKNAGCDFVQGYYFSRPLPPEDLEIFIVREKDSVCGVTATGGLTG